MSRGIQKLVADSIQGEASIKEQPRKGSYNNSRETWQRIRRSFYEPLPSLHLRCNKWMLRLYCSLLNSVILPFRFQLFSYILSCRLNLGQLLFCYVIKTGFPIYVGIDSCVKFFFGF